MKVDGPLSSLRPLVSIKSSSVTDESVHSALNPQQPCAGPGWPVSAGMARRGLPVWDLHLLWPGIVSDGFEPSPYGRSQFFHSRPPWDQLGSN